MIAFLFPGQGSQYVGMGRALAERFPEARAVFEEADAALGEPLSQLMWDGPEDRLTLTEHTQPAILAVSTAVSRVLAARGVQPAMVAGHSLGEYSAHVAAGTFAFADAVRLVRNRGRYMQEAVPVGTGAMAAVLGLGAEDVERACREAAQGDVVSPANFNAPGQVVIAGTTEAVARASAAAKALGARRVVPLPVSAPFHCALMQPAADRLAPELHGLSTQRPSLPVVANVDAELKREAVDAVAALVRQVSAPVRWEHVMRCLADQGITTFVEVGPGTVLCGLGRKIVREATFLPVETGDQVDALLGALTVRAVVE